MFDAILKEFTEKWYVISQKYISLLSVYVCAITGTTKDGFTFFGQTIRKRDRELHIKIKPLA